MGEALILTRETVTFRGRRPGSGGVRLTFMLCNYQVHLGGMDPPISRCSTPPTAVAQGVEIYPGTATRGREDLKMLCGRLTELTDDVDR